ncbi:MAG: hypothetical protein RLZZ524_931 [Pseudomonadota bacterium]
MTYAVEFTPDPAYGLTTFGWDVAEGDDGPHLIAALEVEELTTPGTDGRRWRQVRRLHKPFSRRCIVGGGSAAIVRPWADNLQGLSGSIGTLSMRVGGVPIALRCLIVVESVQVYAAPMVGPGGLYAAHLVSDCTFTGAKDP